MSGSSTVLCVYTMNVNLAAVAGVVGTFLMFSAYAYPKRNHIMKFLHVSDIHFDPFYDKSWSEETYCHTQTSNATAEYEAPYGRIGCDSPESLLDSSLRAMKKHGDGAKFIILSGDSSAHGLTDDHGSKNVLNSMKVVSEKLHELFPRIPVFPVFGNNDLPGHYVLPNSSEWYETVLSYWAPLILCSRCSGDVKGPTTMEDLKKTFLEGGYYSVNIAGGKMVLLALNTMYWNDNWYTNDMVESIANGQFIWLENQLQLAKVERKKVLLMSHIPPGGDPHDSHFFWVPQYARRYVEIVAGKFHQVVAGQLYGHTHKDEFHLQILDATRKSFVLMAPSVSPVYSNNPAFRVVSLDTKKKALLDYDQYYFDLVIATEFSNPVWQKDYTFSKKYPSRNRLVNANRIDALNQQLISQTDGTYWKEYIFSTHVNYQTGPYNRFEMYCVMRHVFEDDFKKCRNKFKVPGG